MISFTCIISKYFDSEINNLDHQITELDIKKAINNSDYFTVEEDYFEIFNNIYAEEKGSKKK